jgi:hypothetical protein
MDRELAKIRCGLLSSVMAKSSSLNPLTTGRPFLSKTVTSRKTSADVTLIFGTSGSFVGLGLSIRGRLQAEGPQEATLQGASWFASYGAYFQAANRSTARQNIFAASWLHYRNVSILRKVIALQNSIGLRPTHLISSRLDVAVRGCGGCGPYANSIVGRSGIEVCRDFAAGAT